MTLNASSGAIEFTGDIVPTADLTYSLGSSTRAIENLWVQTIAKSGVPGVFELTASQGPQIDSNTTGNFQVTHQGTNGRFISDVTGIAFFQNPGGAPVGVAQQTGGAATAGATYTATEQGMLNRLYTAMRNYGLLT